MPSELCIQPTVAHKTDPRTILQDRLSFSAATKFQLNHGVIPKNYNILLPDAEYTSDSPFTQNEDNSVDEESSTSSSPLSYTKELTNVSSPLTPLSDARRSKSKSPSQLTGNNSKFLEEDDEEEVFSPKKSPDSLKESQFTKNGQKAGTSSQFIGPKMPEGISTPRNGLSKQKNGVSLSKNGGMSIEKLFNPVLTPSPKRMTIKIGNERMNTLELSARNPSASSLVPYTSDDSSEEEEEEPKKMIKIKSPTKERPLSPRTIIGPLKPQPVENKPLLSQKRIGEKLTTPAIKRKRLLSERGENEMAYPIMDKSMISCWNWNGFSYTAQRNRGVGLYNASNDCFLNAILQLVTHTAPLCRYIMERHSSHCVRPTGQCVACAFAISHIKKGNNWSNNNGYSSSGVQGNGWIKPHLRRIFPAHENGAQEDAHELLSLLLDAIDPPPSKSNGVINGVNTKPSTPIEQIFGGTLRNQVTCDVCDHVHTYYERIRELNLAVKKKSPDAENVKISFLIEHYFRDENLSSFECKKCSRKTSATRRTKILRPPAVLLVQLKRFNAFGQKIRLPVTAEIDVDLSSFMSDAAPKGSTEYVLTTIVEHLGATIDHGHYVAYCRGFDHKQWYLFDDCTVSPVSGQKVVNSSPYILVYSRREDMPFNQTKKIDNGYPVYGGVSTTTSQKVNGFNKLNGFNGNGNFNRNNYRYNYIK